jgi:trimeric autotransporter adhesin
MSFPYPNQRFTTNLGLSLFGMDEVLADNMNLIDQAYGAGSSVNVNGTLITSPNFNNTTPAAIAGKTNVTWQFDSNGNISAYSSGGGGTPGGPTRSVQFNNAGAFGGLATVLLDASGNLTLSTLTQSVFCQNFVSPTSGVSGLFLDVPSDAPDGFTLFDETENIEVSGSTTLGGLFFIAANSGDKITLDANAGVLFSAGTALLDSTGAAGTSGQVLSSTVTGIRWVSAGGSGTVTSFSSGNLSPLFTTSVATATTTPALSFSLSNAAGGTVFGNATTSAAAPVYTTAPVLGIPGTSTGTIALASSTASGLFTVTAPASAATPTLTLPTTSNVLAGQFAGDGTVLSATLAVASAAGTVTAALANAGGGTVLGNRTGSSAAPTYTIAPVLGVPGTSTGTIALASSTASGKYTITAPANAATPTLTLPTTSNVLAGQFAGDGTVLSSTLAVASAAGTVTASLANAGGGTLLGNATTSSTAPTYTTAPVLGIPGTSTGTIALASSTASGKYTITAPANAATPTLTLPTGTGTFCVSASGALTLNATTGAMTFSGAGAVTWDQIGNAAANLTLANAAFTTTFNQTSAVAWLWANTTVATSGTTNASPLHELAANYWTGAASAADTWTLQSSLAAGTNGASTLTLAHSGSSGSTLVSIPSNTSATVPSLVFTGNTTTGIGNNGSTLCLNSGTSGGIWQFCNTGGSAFLISKLNGGFVSLAVAGSVQMLVLGNIATTATASLAFGQVGNSFTGTSGAQVAATFGGDANAPVAFAPTSGTATFTALRVQPTINQTGGANGNYTALLVNAVETALGGAANKLLDLQAGTTGGTSEFSISNAGVVKTYAATATVAQGMPSEIALSDLTAQSAAVTATNLTASAPRSGRYRVSWSADITTAATTSSVLGGTNGFQVTYTSPTDSVAKTTVSGNSVTSAANTTATATGGSITIYAKTGTAISFTFDYTSVGVTAMVFELHTLLESL